MSLRGTTWLEELQTLLDELLHTDGGVRGDELTDDLLCGSLGIAQHLEGADGLAGCGGVEGLCSPSLLRLSSCARRGEVAFDGRELATEVHEDTLGGLQPNTLDGLEGLDLSESDDAVELMRRV